MEEIKIPSNSLWQYLEKEHLDLDNKLTQEEWEEFVNMFQSTYVDICTEEGQVLFADYCNEKQVYDCPVNYKLQKICLQLREVNAN